jgi:hypothetical protein
MKVNIKLLPTFDGDRRLEGVLSSSDDDSCTVITSAGERRVDFDVIDKAKTVFEWAAQPKPGADKKVAATKATKTTNAATTASTKKKASATKPLQQNEEDPT